MKNIIPFLLIILAITGCNDKIATATLVKADESMLDSVRKASDSTYIKKYYTADFASAQYYLNSKDSTVTQIMRDADSVIRQVIIMRGNVRTHFSAYYDNGQLKAQYLLDSFGQHHGPATEYFRNGFVMSKGLFDGGKRSGEWEVFDSTGKPVVIHKYDDNGQLADSSSMK